MTQSTTARVGRFHQGRLSEGRPQALDAWRITTDDAHVAARLASLLGGHAQQNEGGGGLAHEVLTNRESVRVLMDGPGAVTARMVLWSSKGITHDCDGSVFLSPQGKKGQTCGCHPRLEDKKLAAREGRGPVPSIDLVFRIAAAPTLGEFHFMTSSWQLAAQLSDLMEALERVGGPAACDLTTELVALTTKTGRNVCYRKPVVKVVGNPDILAPACSVSVDAVTLRRAAQVLGTSDHQETVIAALSEVVAARHQTIELARLREHVGRIAAIARQALPDGDFSLT
ncbi:hypothetical protein Sipo8835_14205 [Streptomyces ipomoeae]|uniref:Uncharacterized protein n=1 Tax=Streptomyces ipomoeae TaxID=103232 RepID=A0AAE9B1E0_9ACTN|nr:hypothetical protein [Streptomyces ipomoeae]MDX2826596.1 hypothetical protein [Streptomyces ipomoeae]MDX2879253.1 hypothetical protein [Streptomyces ipomoeae]TQE21122.1 hypothetical protein Sipo7851_41195 [Streptomyces ipomoeae]TQE34820.1 hypothetical protein Sipo8835_14205 [Streptomyces ipomoeae]